jgi:protein-S-isoprenylcysteine O-methyltransferase Ste14
MENERGARVRVPPSLVFVLAVLAGLALDYAMPNPTNVRRSFALVIGYGLAAMGLGLAGWSIVLFRRSGQNPIPWTPTPSLLYRGPYRFTRNPIYVGMTLLQAGLGLWLDNLWVVLLALPALAIVHFTAVLPEERYLREKFGEPYRAYLAAVRRYI